MVASAELPRPLTEVLPLLAALTPIIAGLVLGTAAGIWHFQHPFNLSPSQGTWGIVLAGTFAAIGLLSLLRNGRVLLVAAVVGSAGLGAFGTVASGSLPAALGVAWLLILSLGLGECVLRLLAPNLQSTLAERWVVATGLGLGILALVTLGLGAAGLLYTGLLLALLAAATVLTGPVLVRTARTVLPAARVRAQELWGGEHTRGVAIALAALGVCALGSLVWAVAPPVGYDELNYQVATPAIYIREHAIVQVAEEYRTVWAHNGNMIYTLGMASFGRAFAILFHFSCGVLGAVVAFSLGRRAGGALVGTTAALLYSAVPMVTWEAGTGQIDLMITYLLAASLAGLHIWWDGHDDRWLPIAGVLGGVAIGTKLNAALFLVPAVVLLAIGLWTRHRLVWRTWRDLLLFGLGCAVPAVPWLLRDWIWTGNPVFPYLNHIFRSPLWFADAGLQNFQSYGHRTGLLGFILLPWDTVVHGSAYGESLGPGVVGALLWLALPWTLALRNVGSRRYLLLAWAYLLPSLLLLYNVAQYFRYMLPLFPLLAAVAAVNLHSAWTALRRRWRSRWLTVGATMLLLGYVASGRMAQVSWYWQLPERFPVAHFIGRESNESLLSRAVREYDSLRFLDREGGGTLKVLSVWTPFRLYTSARLYHVSYGHNEALDVLGSGLKGARLARALADRGFSHLLVDTLQPPPKWLEASLLSSEFMSRRARLAFTKNGVDVYRLIAGAASPSEVDNLLDNPGLEALETDGMPRRWSRYGQPIASLDEARAHTGAVAVCSTRDSGLTQAVPVLPNTIYTLGHWTRADEAGQKARLQVNWLGRDSKLVGCSISLVPATGTWTWHTLSSTAPADAVRANVYVSVHESSRVWFDDLCLVEADRIPASGGIQAPAPSESSVAKDKQ